MFSLLDNKKRNRRSHGKRQFKRKHKTVLTISAVSQYLVACETLRKHFRVVSVNPVNTYYYITVLRTYFHFMEKINIKYLEINVK